MNMRAPIIAMIATTVLTLSACSSGGSGSPTVPPPNANMLDIDALNAKLAAQVAYSSATSGETSAGVVGGPGIGANPGGLSKPFAEQQVTGALDRIMRKDPFGPLIEDCFGGGTETTSGNLANPATISPGDTITTIYVDCITEFGETINGTTTMTINSFAGDIFLGNILLDVNLQLSNYAVMVDGETVTINGDTRVALDMTGSPIVSITVSGDSLSATNGVDTHVMTMFRSSSTVDTSVIPEPYTQTSSGTVNSTQLPGIISYTTLTPFQGTGVDYPFVGQMRIDGANNTYILLTAQDNMTVLIEADTTGDGVLDFSDTTTWDDIASGSFTL